MWALFILLIIIFKYNSCQVVSVVVPKANKEIGLCVSDIVKKYYYGVSELTLVDTESDNNEVMKIINELHQITIISRHSNIHLEMFNEGYLILASNVSLISETLTELTREIWWNPYAIFTIVTPIKEDEVKEIFRKLIQLHVFHAIIVDQRNSGIYTYNPFENNGCGKHFTQVIYHRVCANLSTKLFSEQEINLRNCYFKVASFHLPPYVIDPVNIEDNIQLGVEQYVVNFLSQLNGFKVEFIYDRASDTTPNVFPNMTATGNLRLIQTNDVEMIIGAYILTSSRANGFGFLANHLALTDNLRFVVKGADLVPLWKNVCLELNELAWILLLISFILYSIVMYKLLKIEDSNLTYAYLLLIMWDNLLLHGRNVSHKFVIKSVFILWIWFAYLISTYYQSSLFSITANPLSEYQISNEEDLLKYEVKPCVSDGIRKILSVFIDDYKFIYSDEPNCRDFITALNKVGSSSDLYTISLFSILKFSRYKYYRFSSSFRTLYIFNQPLNSISYSIYLYKGFPLMERMNYQTLLLRENGLVPKYFEDIYFKKKLKHFVVLDEYHPTLIFPWYVLVVGGVASTISFVLEILIAKRKQ